MKSALYFAVLSGFLFASFGSMAHAEPPAEPAFDVVSVKVVEVGTGDSNFFIKPGRVYCACLLNQVIQNAFGIRLSRITGPKWLFDPLSAKGVPFLYQFAARFPVDLPAGQVSAMLRRMLSERFHLESHYEVADEPVYALQSSPGGLTLTPEAAAAADSGGAPPLRPWLVTMNNRSGDISFHGAMTMEDLAFHLGSHMDREVINLTGKEGRFNVWFDAKLPSVRPPLFGMGPVPSSDEVSDGTVSIFTRLKEFGLRLTPVKAPIQRLVIDKIDSTRLRIEQSGRHRKLKPCRAV